MSDSDLGIGRRSLLAAIGIVGTSVLTSGCLGGNEAVVSQTVESSQTYRFEAEEGDEISITVVNRDGSFTVVELTTVADRENALVSTPVENEDEFTITAPETGRYELSVVPDERASVTVTVD